LVGYEKLKSDFDAEGISLLAASVDDEAHAKEVQDEVSFPVAHGVTREMADTLGSWWEDKRAIIQPSEFILDPDGKVLSGTYSTGPIGRLEAADALWMIQFLKKRAAAG